MCKKKTTYPCAFFGELSDANFSYTPSYIRGIGTCVFVVWNRGNDLTCNPQNTLKFVQSLKEGATDLALADACAFALVELARGTMEMNRVRPEARSLTMVFRVCPPEVSLKLHTSNSPALELPEKSIHLSQKFNFIILVCMIHQIKFQS